MAIELDPSWDLVDRLEGSSRDPVGAESWKATQDFWPPWDVGGEVDERRAVEIEPPIFRLSINLRSHNLQNHWEGVEVEEV